MTTIDTKNLRPKETITRDSRRCNNCLKIGTKLQVCGRCKNVRYCNKSCQKTHWKEEHKLSCGKTLPRDDELFPCDVDDDRNEFRKYISSLYDKTKQHCMICGDTEKECSLRRTKCGILCTDCKRIQLSM